jgi:hypothetical protein
MEALAEIISDFFNSIGQTRSFGDVGSMSGLPPKADFPILELLPPPALGERRHRGLARRLEAWRRIASFGIAGSVCA